MLKLTVVFLVWCGIAYGQNVTTSSTNITDTDAQSTKVITEVISSDPSTTPVTVNTSPAAVSNATNKPYVCKMVMFEQCLPPGVSLTQLINTAKSTVYRLTIQEVDPLCQPDGSLDKVQDCMNDVQGPCTDNKPDDFGLVNAALKATRILCQDQLNMDVYRSTYGCVTLEDTGAHIDRCVKVMEQGVYYSFEAEDACTALNEGLMCEEDVLFEDCGEEAAQVHKKLSQVLLDRLGSQLKNCHVSAASSVTYSHAIWMSVVLFLSLCL